MPWRSLGSVHTSRSGLDVLPESGREKQEGNPRVEMGKLDCCVCAGNTGTAGLAGWDQCWE